AIGGLLLAATSVHAIYAIDTLSFGAVIAALAAIGPRPAGLGGADHENLRPNARPWGFRRFREDGADAIRFLRSKPALVWLMLLDFFATFFGGSLLLLPIFASEVFHVGARGLGWLVSAPAVGALAASAWLSYRPPARQYGLIVLGAIAVYGASIA